MKRTSLAFLPAMLLSLLLAGIFLLPENPELASPSISDILPEGHTLEGWNGYKVQESEAERKILAADTRFSKARYTSVKRVPWEEQKPAVEVSIVFSGQEMNNSIHRPEVCLPAQGHINVQGQVSELQLADGRTLKMTRLSSKLPTRQERRIDLHYIHYYLFIGNGAMAHSHMGRNIQDILDRCIQGKVQSWAYFQAGTCWAPEIGVTEEEADKRLRKLISELLPGQIKWDEM